MSYVVPLVSLLLFVAGKSEMPTPRPRGGDGLDLPGVLQSPPAASGRRSIVAPADRESYTTKLALADLPPSRDPYPGAGFTASGSGLFLSLSCDDLMSGWAEAQEVAEETGADGIDEYEWLMTPTAREFFGPLAIMAGGFGLFCVLLRRRPEECPTWA